MAEQDQLLLTKTVLQPAPDGSSGRTSRDMPRVLLERSVKRLQLVSLTFAVLMIVAWCFPLLIVGEFDDEFETPLQWAPPIITLLASLVVLVIARSNRISPSRIVTAGLVYQVVVSYCLPLSQYWGAFEGMDLRYFTWDQVGFSVLAIWIFFFTVLVPSRPRDALIALTISGAAAPITIGILIRIGRAPEPAPLSFFFDFVFPYIICVVMAYICARIIYRLGKDVSRAEKMGSYCLTSCIGRGGMGEVWEAKHNLLARPAAVKLIRQDALSSSASTFESILTRFEREAQATASLESPHTVRLYDFGINDDQVLYYVMELLEGIDLESMVERFGPLDAERVVHIMRQTCHSLGEAHRQGLIHRDIKPANIYLCRRAFEYDFVKVLDFGLVKQQATSRPDLEATMTMEGSITGTPSYIAPEMAIGKDNIDGRADIYGLGCVAYWLLTGHRVFEEESGMAVIAAHVKSQPVPPSERAELVIPPTLEALVLDCLAKEVDARPGTAEELERRLREIEFADPWTGERATQWWQTHYPAL